MNKLLSVFLAVVAVVALNQSAPPRVEPHIRLSRSACYGACPVYLVDVWADGRVRYEGKRHVEVSGVHEYRIAPAQAAALFERADAIGFWSMQAEYRSGTTDHPTTIVRIDLEKASHSVLDYIGEDVGMPFAMRAFQNDIDRVTHAADFVHLGLPAVDALLREGFHFDSIDGATLLAAATACRKPHDEAALIRLIELGAPMSGAREQTGLLSILNPRHRLLEDALANRHTRLADLLIKRGALETNGRFDAAKRDDALIFAIRGGLLAPVQQVWNSGPRDAAPPHLDRDALTSAFRRPQADRPSQSAAIAAWLTAQGKTR